MKNHKSLLPYLALGTGILALSMSAMFVRWADAPGPVTGFYRLLFSTVLLTPVFVYNQRKAAPLSYATLVFPVLAGLFTAFDFTFWNSSLAFTTASNATLLGNTSPLWVALGAMLIFRERLGSRFWTGLAVALAGALELVAGAVVAAHLVGAHERLVLGGLGGGVARCVGEPPVGQGRRRDVRCRPPRLGP